MLLTYFLLEPKFSPLKLTNIIIWGFGGSHFRQGCLSSLRNLFPRVDSELQKEGNCLPMYFIFSLVPGPIQSTQQVNNKYLLT